MTIAEIYNLAIKMGIEADPRGESRVLELLKKEKANFKELKKEEQEEFDQERFSNPYADSRILYGDRQKKVKRVLLGIDISVSDILLADRLADKGKKIDLVISHHPIGKALAKLDDIVMLQAEFLAQLGLPINIAESLIEVRAEELTRSLSPGNFNRAVDSAKILDIPLISAHTALDNLVYQYLTRQVDQEKPELISDLLKLIKSIAEYSQANKIGLGPKIFVGKPNRHCGRIAVAEFTGGTSGSKYVYEKLAHIGIGTIVSMHMKEEYREEAQKYHINVVIAGHTSSDSVGMNLFADELEKRGIEVIPCSGFIRVKRFKK